METTGQAEAINRLWKILLCIGIECPSKLDCLSLTGLSLVEIQAKSSPNLSVGCYVVTSSDRISWKQRLDARILERPGGLAIPQL